MLGDRRSRLAALLWAASAVAILSAACGSPVEEPPPGARLVASGPAEPVTPDMATAAALRSIEAAAASPTPEAEVTPTRQPVVQAPAAIAASPTPNGAASAPRKTAPATFLVDNTLGRGMALRPAPITRVASGKPWPDGTKMAGLGQEQEAYGWTWRWVRDPDGNVGWMPSNYLVVDEETPPSGISGLHAPSAPPTLIIVPTFATPEPKPISDVQPTPEARTSVDSRSTPTTRTATDTRATPASSPVAPPTPRPDQGAPAPPAPPRVPAQGLRLSQMP